MEFQNWCNYNYYIYSIGDDKAVLCGEIYGPYNDCLYEYDGNGIIIHDGGSSELHLEYIILYTLENNLLKYSELLKSTEFNTQEEIDEYLNKISAINEFHPISDLSYLTNWDDYIVF